MRKIIGGVALLVLAAYLLRNGVTTDAVLGQLGKVWSGLVQLGADLANHVPASKAKP